MKGAMVKTLSADQRIQRAIISMLRTSPLYASYLLRWPRVEVGHGTMAVDGRVLRYNSEFVGKLSDRRLDYVLRHEVAHVMLKHHLRWENYERAELLRDDRLVGREFFREANTWADLEVNGLLNSEPNIAAMMPEEGIVAGRGDYADLPERKTMDEYREILRPLVKQDDKPPEEESAAAPSGSDDSSGSEAGNESDAGAGDDDKGAELMSDEGMGGCGDLLPMPDSSGMTQAELQAESQRLDQEFVAAVMSIKDQGKVPAWARARADAITSKAELGWRALLRRWARRSCSGGQSTYARPSRRSAWRRDVVLPSKRTQSIRRVLFIVDTSGSMSLDEVNAAVPEMLAIMSTWRKAELHVAQCDAAVGDVAVYKSGSGFRKLQSFARSPQWSGRGGTDMQPAFALAATLKPEAIVCLTDGYFTAPAPVAIPTLWLMTTDYAPPNFGDSIRLKSR